MRGTSNDVSAHKLYAYSSYGINPLAKQGVALSVCDYLVQAVRGSAFFDCIIAGLTAIVERSHGFES